MTTQTRYRTPAVLLHWLIAILIIAALGLAFYLDGLPLTPAKLKLISYHKWVGVTVLILFLPRLLVRLTHPAPASPVMPYWQMLAASLTHGLLYILMLAIPVTGWLMSSAKGFPVVYLGLIPLPDLVAKDAALGDALKQVHEALNLGLLTLLGLHVAAALKHHAIDRDETLVRMLPILKRAN